ncbi:MAG TPA: M23 family metallopeptidase [Candidatus Doudnabacteria bacterium]|nr:M23 family metallopeptidase [Candidatus Doudnabacteria bacterium]
MRKLIFIFALVLLMSPLTTHATVDGFDFPLGKTEGTGYVPGASQGGLDFLDPHDYQSDTYEEYHPGEDWNDDNSGNDYGGDSNDAGDPIYSIANGTVLYADYYSSGWGYLMLIEHPYTSTVWSQYGHMASITNNPRTSNAWEEEDEIFRGEQIGTVGDFPNGSSSAYHLHFEIRKQYQVAQAFPYNTSHDSPWPESEVEEYYHHPSAFIAANRGTIYTQGEGTDQTPVWVGLVLRDSDYLVLPQTSPIKFVTIKLDRTSGDGSCYAQEFSLRIRNGVFTYADSTNSLPENSGDVMRFEFDTNTIITPYNLTDILLRGLDGGGSGPWTSPCNDWDTNVKMIGEDNTTNTRYYNTHNSDFEIFLKIEI